MEELGFEERYISKHFNTLLWLGMVIYTLNPAHTGRSLSFQDILVYIVSSCLKQRKEKDILLCIMLIFLLVGGRCDGSSLWNDSCGILQWGCHFHHPSDHHGEIGD